MDDTNTLKKVLFFIPRYPVLTETFIDREISKLSELGNLDILIISTEKGDGVVSENLKEKVIYIEISPLDIIKGFLTFFLSKPQNYHLLKTTLDSDSNSLNNLYIFVKSFGYAYALEKFNARHLHAHFLSDSSSVGMFVSKFLNLDFSISAHARDIYVTSSLVKQKILSAKFIVICNKKAFDYLKEKFNSLDTSRLKLMYHGLDYHAVFGGSEISKKDSDTLKLISIARFTEKKGLKYLVEAASILRDRGVSFKLNIAGRGSEYNSLKDQIANLNLQNFVFLPGNGSGVPNKELMAMLVQSDIFVFPNIEAVDKDVDGIPNGLVEAAFAKVPIITTNAGSNFDLIDENSALIVPQRDAVSLAESIITLAHNSDLQNAIREQAFINAQERLNLNKNVINLEKLFL